MIRDPYVPSAPMTWERRQAWQDYQLALVGELPGEALVWPYRNRLVGVLHRAGWSDTEISVHTLWTAFTVARIRGGMGLAPNKQVRKEGRSA